MRRAGSRVSLYASKPRNVRHPRELAARLTRSSPGLSVLYVSGYTDRPLLLRGGLESDTAFLPKPFLPELLVHKVDEVLQSHPAPEPR